MKAFLPVPADARFRRIVQLYLGLILYGASTAFMVRAGLGLNPWDVFHQGVAERTPFTIGQITILTSIVVLLLWIPMRQRLGVGTVSNAVVIGLSVDASLTLVTQPESMVWRVVFLAIGVVFNGIATGVYIGAGLGPGPRDGLMTGIAARGHSIRVVRTGLELAVLLGGWLLGGTVGLGTAIYALAIGPIAHVTIPAFTIAKAIALDPHREPLPR